MGNGIDRDKKRSAGAYNLSEVLARVGQHETIPPVDSGAASPKERLNTPYQSEASAPSITRFPPRIPPTSTSGAGGAESTSRADTPPPLSQSSKLARHALSGPASNLPIAGDQRVPINHAGHTQPGAQLGRFIPHDTRVHRARWVPAGIALIGSGICLSFALAWAFGLFEAEKSLPSVQKRLQLATVTSTAVTSQLIEVDIATQHQETGLAGAPPNTSAVRQPLEDHDPVQRLIAPNIVVTAGAADVPWPIQFESADGPLPGFKIIVSGLPAAALLSHGLRGTDGTWTLTPFELPGLTLALPAQASSARLTVLLTAGDGVEIARLDPTLDVRPPVDDNSPFGKNDVEEKSRDLLQQGETHLSVGDVAGARMFFKKAANAGDANGAMALGRTYEPEFFAARQVRGMASNVDEARRWYQRAIDLGSKEAFDHLERLKPN